MKKKKKMKEKKNGESLLLKVQDEQTLLPGAPAAMRKRLGFQEHICRLLKDPEVVAFAGGDEVAHQTKQSLVNHNEVVDQLEAGGGFSPRCQRNTTDIP